MIPEAEFIRKDYCIREMDFPESVGMTKNSLLRWCCLSLGLISPNETRDKALKVFDALFYFLFTKKESPTTLEIQSQIKEKHSFEISEKLIRYHLNHLIELNILIRKKGKYLINPSPSSERRDSLKDSFNSWFSEQIKKEVEKTGNSLEKLQEIYSK